MFDSTQEFVANGLPKLINTQQNLRAVFSSYNTIHGFSNGPVDTHKQGLSIFVQSGGYVPDLGELFLMDMALSTGDIETAAATLYDVESDARQAQKRASFELTTHEETSTLAVIYAGLSAFDAALEFTHELRSQSPKARIIVLTCDCDLGRKTTILKKAVEEGQIDDFIVTMYCGGHSDMGEIVRSLIDLWPSAH